ncbi:DsbA family protein [Candidatus Peregrinibacteria bacterium]|nr:DsbA family protein [Candidatus Peregrinibacteria bacterium]
MNLMLQYSKKLHAVAIALSIIALGVAGYAYKCVATYNDDSFFNSKVEKGIEAYIKKQQDEQNKPPAAAEEPVEVSVDNDALKGDANAPVTIVEFSEYQCPYCKRYVDQTLSQINEKYIKTGKVKYVFRDFPLGFHQNAKPAAMAAECVHEKGGDEAYWKYHDVLFANQSAIDPDSLKKYAKEMGYDIAACLDNEKFADEVEADLAEGQKYGVQGTPAFFVNGRLVSGAVPFEVFETAIEEELAK